MGHGPVQRTRLLWHTVSKLWGTIRLPTRLNRRIAIALLAGLIALPSLAGQVSLAWDASAAPSTGHYVYYGVAPRTYTSQIDVGNQTTYTVPNLTAGQTYFFAVTAYDALQNQSSFSNEVSVTIAATAPTQTALASLDNPVIVGATVTFTATVTGSAPTGYVTFTAGATTIAGCSTVTLVGTSNVRTALCATATLAAGTHSIVARYNGDASNGASSSAPVTQLVDKIGTATSLMSSFNPSTLGAGVTLTASVTGSEPTGTINFVDGGTSITGCAAQSLSGTGNTRTAICTTSSLALGTHSIVASYAGNATNASSSGAPLIQVVDKVRTITTLARSLNPSRKDTSVKLTASVTGSDPTGTVNFLDGSTSITGCAARNLVGSGNTRTATCTASGLSSGTHSIVAHYDGDATNATSTSAMLLKLVEAPSPTFADVPAEYWAYSAIEAVAYNSMSLGCASNPRRFCPDDFLARDEMAVFLERATRGIGYPFAPNGVLFADVPITHWAVGPIEQLYTDGITRGCGVSPLRFCPENNVTRAEVAILLLRARFGPGYDPGSATGLVFADVPSAHWAAAWIEDFAAMGYTLGCRVTPHDFCPDDVVTRASMAVFLQRVFNLPGPPP